MLEANSIRKNYIQGFLFLVFLTLGTNLIDMALQFSLSK